jgi:hypothetical protein
MTGTTPQKAEEFTGANKGENAYGAAAPRAFRCGKSFILLRSKDKLVEFLPY